MTKFLFNKWIDEQYIPAVRGYLLEQNSPLSCVLLFDNCSSHLIPKVYFSEDRSFRLQLLPKNTTAILQPLDAGIIQNLKVKYLQNILSKIVYQNKIKLDQFLKNISLLDCLFTLASCWEAVKEETIFNCFQKCFMNTNDEAIKETSAKESSKR